MRSETSHTPRPSPRRTSPSTPPTPTTCSWWWRPSGAGKSTLVNKLLSQDSAIRLSISHTTRKPPSGRSRTGREALPFHERGRVSRRARTRGEFLEWAEVHGNLPRDVPGLDRAADGPGQRRAARDRRGRAPSRSLAVAERGGDLHPAAVVASALEERLEKRGQDEPNVIVRRLLAAGSEMSHASGVGLRHHQRGV